MRYLRLETLRPRHDTRASGKNQRRTNLGDADARDDRSADDDNDGGEQSNKCGQQLVCYVGRSYQQVPRKTFKKQRLAVAESGARLLSVRDAGTGVYTQQRC